jgi:histone arginine demethylase JMJD6
MLEVARRPGLEYGLFVLQHLLPRVPVVVPGASAEMAAVQRWTPIYLKETLGNRSVRVDRAGRFESTSLWEFLDGLESRADANEAPYLRNLSLLEHLPDLIGDVQLPCYCSPNWLASEELQRFVPPVWATWIELFVSGPGVRFPRVHVDTGMTHAWVIQVYGKKRFWAWPPMGDQPNYSIHSEEQMRQRGLDCCGRDLETFFAHAAPVQACLEPGDFLFLPTGWWHTAESLTPSISLSGNFVNESNWDDFCHSWFWGLKFKSGLGSLADLLASGGPVGGQ